MSELYALLANNIWIAWTAITVLGLFLLLGLKFGEHYEILQTKFVKKMSAGVVGVLVLGVVLNLTLEHLGS